MPQLIWRLLISKGITEKSDIDDLVNPSLNDLSHPYVIDGMKVACERFFQALQQKEKICIYGDFDLDGSSGVALLYQGLTGLGFEDLVLYQPKRLSEGYGFHANVVEKLKKDGVSLIITVDVGITAVEAVAKANSLGIDVVITDHHLPKEEFPESLAILNPNKGSCPSGLGHLCGCGVGFYFIMGLKILLEEQGIKHSLNLKSLLDLFTIGTLTDMVPLIKENRSLVKYGMRELKETKHPGLKYLLKELKLLEKPSLTSQDIAIRFAPKLNALSRLEKGILPLDVFIEEEEAKAKSLIQEVIDNNEMRVRLQKEACESAKELSVSFSDKNFICIASEDYHKGVVGLVATRLTGDFNKCSFVGSIKEGVITGSARVPKNTDFNLVEALESCSDSLMEFGGHAQAAGFKLSQDKLPEMIEQLNEHFSAELIKEKGSAAKKQFYNVKASLTEFNADVLKWMNRLQPFGVGFEEPIFLIDDIYLQQVKEMRGGHLRLTVASLVHKKAMTAVWFSPEVSFDEVSAQINQPIKMLVEAQGNYFAGRETLQLLVKEFALNA